MKIYTNNNIEFQIDNNHLCGFQLFISFQADDGAVLRINGLEELNPDEYIQKIWYADKVKIPFEIEIVMDDSPGTSKPLEEVRIAKQDPQELIEELINPPDWVQAEMVQKSTPPPITKKEVSIEYKINNEKYELKGRSGFGYGIILEKKDNNYILCCFEEPFSQIDNIRQFELHLNDNVKINLS